MRRIGSDQILRRPFDTAFGLLGANGFLFSYIRPMMRPISLR